LPNGSTIDENYQKFKQPFRIDSFFYQGGAGVKYNLSRRIDIDTRVMYIISGDDEFDGGGETPDGVYNQIKKNYSDNMIVANVGVTIKLGKHNTHLSWYDAQNESLRKIVALESRSVEPIICERGDADKDGVCDDWDRELDTPLGARVDGAGKALDMDLDGVIDLNDACVAVPGLAKNKGCPYLVDETLEIIEEINRFEGIEFELNKDVIRVQSYAKLDNAAEVIKKLNSTVKFYVIGGTDTRASDSYNFDLSQRRANAVKNYLVGKGVNPDILITEGRGEKDLKYPECNPATKCPEWKNEANRRVYFKAAQ
jgi:OOP family OmpA-OmpF porin